MTTDTADGRQLSQDPTRDYIHVMLTSFSYDETELKKGIILGVAEETHEELVACVKETVTPNCRNYEATDVFLDPLFQTYLNEKLAHLTRELKSSLQLAYKIVRENIRMPRRRNKEYYDRKSNRGTSR
jgi:hypothetical protein